MKNLLGNVGEIHTPRVNPNFRRIATPPPEPYNFFDEFDLMEDQLLFSTTSIFNDKDAGMLDLSFVFIMAFVLKFFRL
jgi:hypothetical protein